MVTLIYGAVLTDVVAFFAGAGFANLPSRAIGADSAFNAEFTTLIAFATLLAIGRPVDPFVTVGASVRRKDR